jgi:hypothetical protein
MKSPGVHLAKRIDKMGMRSSDTAVIYFDDVRVPAANIIGEPGSKFRQHVPAQFVPVPVHCSYLYLVYLYEDRGY